MTAALGVVLVGGTVTVTSFNPDTHLLAEYLQPMISEQLMRSWTEGLQAGLEMARKMAAGVLEEVVLHVDTGNEQEQAAYAAQAAVLNALVSALSMAAEEAGAAATPGVAVVSLQPAEEK